MDKDYNHFDFELYFKHINIELIKVKEYYHKNVFLKDFQTKSFPKLIFIDRRKIVLKNYFSAFKHCVKRNQDSKSFFSLLMMSTNKLLKNR